MEFGDDLDEVTENAWANESPIDIISDICPASYRAMYSSPIDEDGEGDWL
jgi:hypothetical protein